MKKILTVLLCLVLAAPGCATRQGVPRAATPSSVPWTADAGVMADAVNRIPVGTRLRVHLADGRTVRGTLMHAGATSIIINPRVRVPEPPIEVPLDELRGFEIETPSTLAKAITLGAVAGAGAALVVFLVILATIDD